MKKKIAMVLAVGLVLSCLQGCGSTNEPSNESEASSEQTGAEVSAGDEESESAIVLEPSNEENEPVLPHYDPTPEILEATWGDGMFQVADMVFCINNVMSEAEVRSIIEASDTKIHRNRKWFAVYFLCTNFIPDVSDARFRNLFTFYFTYPIQ